MIVLSCQFILLFGILKILSGKKKFTRMKEKLKNKYPKTQIVVTLGTINIINL